MRSLQRRSGTSCLQHKKMEKENKGEKAEKKEKNPEFQKEKLGEELVRIMTTDIPASLSIYAGLTRIKGISWPMSNAICHILKIDKKRKVSTLTPKEIEAIEAFIKNPELPEWMLNRRKDIETGISKHLISTELDLQREFDIRKMKKMRCYKGIRHMLGQPVRGQRTKSHFRKGKVVSVSRMKAKPGKAK